MSISSVTPRFVSELRSTALLALPLVFGHVSVGLIGFVDNLIAGHHGTQTLGAVTIGVSLLWLPMLVPIGVLISLTASVSQLYGAGQDRQIGPLFRQALWLSLCLGVLMFAFLSAAPLLLPMFAIAPDIVPGATAFLDAVRWGAPAMTLYFCMRYLTEAMHWTMPTMVLGFGGLLVLAPVGYVLTYGHMGFASHGAAGLGMASAMTMWLQTLALGLYLWRSKRFACLRLFAGWERPRWAPIRGLLRTGLPIGVTVLMEGSLFIVTALLIGHLGATETAAHQIAINVAQLCFMVPMAVAEATTVRVGYAVGRGDAPAMRCAAWAGYAIVLTTQTLSAMTLLLGHTTIAGLYTEDLAVVSLASTLLLYAAAFQFPDGIQVLSVGALRGLKDTRVPMFLAIFSYWGLGMPLGVGLGLGLRWGPQGMWIGLILGLTAAALMMALRFRRTSRGFLP